MDRSDTYNLKLGGEGGSKHGHTVSDKVRERIGALNRGVPVPVYRRKMISNKLKGRKRSLHSLKMSKKKWFNDGKISVMRETCPDGFVEGRICWKNMTRNKKTITVV